MSDARARTLTERWVRHKQHMLFRLNGPFWRELVPTRTRLAKPWEEPGKKWALETRLIRILISAPKFPRLWVSLKLSEFQHFFFGGMFVLPTSRRSHLRDGNQGWHTVVHAPRGSPVALSICLPTLAGVLSLLAPFSRLVCPGVPGEAKAEMDIPLIRSPDPLLQRASPDHPWSQS